MHRMKKLQDLLISLIIWRYSRSEITSLWPERRRILVRSRIFRTIISVSWSLDDYLISRSLQPVMSISLIRKTVSIVRSSWKVKVLRMQLISLRFISERRKKCWRNSNIWEVRKPERSLSRIRIWSRIWWNIWIRFDRIKLRLSSRIQMRHLRISVMKRLIRSMDLICRRSL